MCFSVVAVWLVFDTIISHKNIIWEQSELAAHQNTLNFRYTIIAYAVKTSNIYGWELNWKSLKIVKSKGLVFFNVENIF